MTSCNFLYCLCKKFAFLARWANLLHSNLCNFRIYYLESCAFKYAKFLSPFNHSPEYYKLWLSPRNTSGTWSAWFAVRDRQRKFFICFSEQVSIVWSCFAAISSTNYIFPVYNQIKSCLWFSARIWKADTEILIVSQ